MRRNVAARLQFLPFRKLLFECPEISVAVTHRRRPLSPAAGSPGDERRSPYQSRWIMVSLVEFDRRPGSAAASNGRAVEAMENGDVIYLPHDAFSMTNRER